MEVMFAEDTNSSLVCMWKLKMSQRGLSHTNCLNVDKTKWFLFHRLSKRQLLPQILPNLFIENVHIKRKHVTKFLGVFIEENVSWKQNIDVVSSKISINEGIS